MTADELAREADRCLAELPDAVLSVLVTAYHSQPLGLMRLPYSPELHRVAASVRSHGIELTPGDCWWLLRTMSRLPADDARWIPATPFGGRHVPDCAY